MKVADAIGQCLSKNSHAVFVRANMADLSPAFILSKLLEDSGHDMSLWAMCMSLAHVQSQWYETRTIIAGSAWGSIILNIHFSKNSAYSQSVILFTGHFCWKIWQQMAFKSLFGYSLFQTTARPCRLNFNLYNLDAKSEGFWTWLVSQDSPQNSASINLSLFEESSWRK